MNEQQNVELKLIHMEDVVSKEVEWLWYPYIPYGKITIIEGDPGEGKTTLVLMLAAASLSRLGVCKSGFPAQLMAFAVCWSVKM